MTRYREGWVDASGIFGATPIKAEGQAVLYDNDPRMPIFKEYILDVSFDPRDGEFQEQHEEWQE